MRRNRRCRGAHGRAWRRRRRSAARRRPQLVHLDREAAASRALGRIHEGDAEVGYVGEVQLAVLVIATYRVGALEAVWTRERERGIEREVVADGVARLDRRAATAVGCRHVDGHAVHGLALRRDLVDEGKADQHLGVVTAAGHVDRAAGGRRVVELRAGSSIAVAAHRHRGEAVAGREGALGGGRTIGRRKRGDRSREGGRGSRRASKPVDDDWRTDRRGRRSKHSDESKCRYQRHDKTQ